MKVTATRSEGCQEELGTDPVDTPGPALPPCARPGIKEGNADPHRADSADPAPAPRIPGRAGPGSHSCTHLAHGHLVAQPHVALGQQPLGEGPAGQKPGQGQQQLTATLGAVVLELHQRPPRVALGVQHRLHPADLSLCDRRRQLRKATNWRRQCPRP